MPISPYVARLREAVGTDLLLLPSITVLPRDDRGRVLMVRQSDTGQWGTIGGSVEVDEDPADAAVRESKEEAGVDVRLDRIAGALGGPDFHVTYPTGDHCAYVVIVYDATVVGGAPEPDGDETLDAAWVAEADLPSTDLTDFARTQFTALGIL